MRKAGTRETKKPAASGGIRWRLWFGVAIAAAVCVSSAVAARKVHDFMISDPAFTLARYQNDSITITGVRNASLSKIQRAFAADLDHSIFSVPLAERRRRLLSVDWVEDAAISRVWPDRLTVRIRERKPVAFLDFHGGVLLIDAYGVLLEPPSWDGTAQRFSFPVLSGVNVEEPEPVREQRVHALLRVQDELGYLAKDISEVNAADLENVRVITKADNRAVELILGDANFGRRYRNFLNHYPEIAKQSPGVRTFDLRLDDRITAKD